MTSTAEQQLNFYFGQLNEEEQNSVLQLLQTFIKSKSQSPAPISLEQYNIEIDEALTEVENGDTLSHEEVVHLSKQW